MSENLPFNGFRKPEEWDRLVGLTNVAVDPNLPYFDQLEAHAVAIDEIRAIKEEDGELFDRIRYFALSKATCYVVQAAMRSENESRLIEAAADRLCHLNSPYDKPQDDGIHLGGTDDPFDMRKAAPWISEIIFKDKEYQALDYAERLVMNSVDHRMVDLLSGSGNPDGSAIRSVAGALFSGAGTVMYSVLVRAYEKRIGRPPIVYTPIKEFITPEEIEEMDLVKIGAQAASLRIDELSYLYEFLSINESGEIEFDINRKKEESRPGPADDLDQKRLKFSHEARIGCPALYVRGALPFILGLMPKIVAKAQRELLARAT